MQSSDIMTMKTTPKRSREGKREKMKKEREREGSYGSYLLLLRVPHSMTQAGITTLPGQPGSPLLLNEKKT